MTRVHALMTLRAPEPGRVKTRLARGVGRDAALALYRAFVADELAALDAFGEDGAGLPVTVFVHPPEQVDAMADWLGPDPAGRPRRVAAQRGEDLGERMRRAFEQAFGEGAEAALLVGGDLPELSALHLDAACAALRDAGAALAPSGDGGYTLVAFTRAAFRPDIFRDIEWSTPQVLEQTLARFKVAGQAVTLLPELPDVDTAIELAALAARWRDRPEDPDRPAHTLAALREQGSP